MKSLKVFVTTLLVFILPSLAIAAGSVDLVVHEKEGAFADVRQDLIDAIINQGYVIDYNGRVGDMLKRTRADVGGRPLYRNAEYIVFCSALLSRKMMEADMQNIALCPFVISVYEKNSSPGTVYVSYRKVTSAANTDASLTMVDKMFDEISREAVE